MTPFAEAPCTYQLNFAFQFEKSCKKVDCPVRDYLYQAATAVNINLCRHFFNRHHSHSLYLLEDGCVPYFWTLCGMLVSLFSLSQNHKGSNMCPRNIICKEAAQLHSYKFLFTIDGVDLKKVEKFEYLGRQIYDRPTDL